MRKQLKCTTNGRRGFIIFLVCFLFESTVVYSQESPGVSAVRLNLAKEVKEFDNKGQPLILTLLRIAADYHLPMGIERVVREALERPMVVQLKQGAVGDLLDLCLHQIPGYLWAERSGAIHVYGTKELNDDSNLFNFIIPSYEINNESINKADRNLRIRLLFEKESASGIVGSFSPGPELDDPRISLRAQDSTVRDILNQLVALHGEVVWIARVEPERLSQIPQAGLWKLLPRSVRDPKKLLELEPK